MRQPTVGVERDSARVESIQQALHDDELDALVCSLPANVLLLTGYWPVVGMSLAIVARGPRTLLIVPEDESDLADQGWADEVHTYQPAVLADLRTPQEAIRAPLASAVHELGITLHRLAYDDGGTIEPASYAALHLFGPNLLPLLREAFPSAHLRLPRRHSIGCGRSKQIARSIAYAGRARQRRRHLRKAQKLLVPGLTEHQAAELFHHGVCEPISTTSSNRVGGFTWCMSGPNSAQACAAYARSTERVLQRGDLALVHCNSYAGGLWTDITRTYSLGPVDERAERMYDAVFAARTAALDAVRPGVKSAAVDEAARRVLGDYGWEDAFKHSAGHGVGFGAIDAQALPRLHPKSSDILQPGMVFNLEPAVYFAGYGGLRHCDVIALTSRGPEVLTRFQDSAGSLALS